MAPVSKSGFYKWRKHLNQPPTTKQLEDEYIKKWIFSLDKTFNHTYGYPRLTKEINILVDKPINHKRVYRLQKELGLKAQIFKKKKNYTNEGFTSKNRLNRDFQAHKPFEKWVTDITNLFIYWFNSFIFICHT
ncbi:transposase [Bacillus sp. V3B]|uniref:IS3 family transposase n=1 Tax=Bacillus sp. V3B TaxID=2804915 RepID=UPI00210AB2F6|nr:IS3 family transposase [Bacillus sp. V3B]MCQ6277048.1 transposase [Bacillus sp. V3B]